MTTSEQINEIAAALAKAQASMKNATLNKVNPHFRAKYADLAGIRDAVIPALTANGIAVVQTLDHRLVGPDGSVGPAVYTRLIHVSGQWIESLCPIPAAPDMQKMGSAITYARRYSLSAICGIAADEDDDANAASEPAKAPVKTAEPSNYRDWRDDLAATADDGIEALQQAWTKSDHALRRHLTTHDNAWWEALKAKATKTRTKVPA